MTSRLPSPCPFINQMEFFYIWCCHSQKFAPDVNIKFCGLSEGFLIHPQVIWNGFPIADFRFHTDFTFLTTSEAELWGLKKESFFSWTSEKSSHTWRVQFSHCMPIRGVSNRNQISFCSKNSFWVKNDNERILFRHLLDAHVENV